MLRNLVESYEVEPDKHHTIWNIRTLYRAVGINDHLACLGTMLTFDALISNTDRHPENWGLLAKPDASGAWTFEPAPLFDHGTSLAYMLKDEVVAGKEREGQVQRYLDRGKHHPRWSRKNDERRHVQLCGLFAQRYATARPAMLRALDFSVDMLQDDFDQCSRFVLPAGAFVQARGEFLLRLIGVRQEALKTAIGG